MNSYNADEIRINNLYNDVIVQEQLKDKELSEQKVAKETALMKRKLLEQSEQLLKDLTEAVSNVDNIEYSNADLVVIEKGINLLNKFKEIY